MNLTQKYFNEYLNNNFLFEKKPKIAVAVSGGPDSMCLLFLLNNWIKFKKGNLIALIIDHNLRKESNTEANEVREYLINKKIFSKIIIIRKKKLVKKNMHELRDNRYNLLLKYCNQNNILHLFIGHHYDDNLETFLIRKISGSNFEGLRCMQNKFYFNGLQILRPLLNVSKKKIINYNKTNKIQFMIDPSNKNLNYTRAIIRNFLNNKPKYKKEIIRDFSNIIKNYYLYKSMIFQIFHNLIIDITKNSVIILKEYFFKQDVLIQCKIIEIIYRYLEPAKNFLRYKKILISLDGMKKTNIVQTNLAGMIMKKEQFTIKFIN